YSIGVIEHFEDPTDMMAAHLRYLRPGGIALLLMPNYSGINVRMQRALDPDNLAIHNLDLMDPRYWHRYSDRFPGYSVAAAYFGRPSPWLLSFQKFGLAGRVL